LHGSIGITSYRELGHTDGFKGGALGAIAPITHKNGKKINLMEN